MGFNSALKGLIFLEMLSYHNIKILVEGHKSQSS